MDELVRKTFDDLAAGAPVDDLSGMSRKLLYACFEVGGDPDPERRLAALRVAANLEATERVRVFDPMIRDADPRVRRYAFNLACAAQEHGIECLRSAVNGNDIELAVDALGLLVRQLDRGSAMHARNWLHHSDPRIRAGSAILLGNVSGPAMAVHLGRLAQTDPVLAVRVYAAEAVERCTGEAPKAEAENYWEAGPVDLDFDTTPVDAKPAPKQAVPAQTASDAVPKLPPRNPQNLATLYPEDGFEEEEVAQARAAAAAALVPRAASDAPEVVHDTPRDWRQPAAMPAALPSEPLALLKLYGMVQASDRPTVLRAFQATDEKQQAQALASWNPGGNADAGRGIALVVKALQSKTHASMLRVMLKADAAGVRAGAAEAVGATGTLSMIPQLSDLLNDGDADVRAAAVRGLGELLRRLERFAMLRERLEPMADDPSEVVKTAVAEALAALS